MFLRIEINGGQQIEWDGPFQRMDVKRHGWDFNHCDN
jgi:hypothetical protein